jgi:hypothetical protein
LHEQRRRIYESFDLELALFLIHPSLEFRSGVSLKRLAGLLVRNIVDDTQSIEKPRYRQPIVLHVSAGLRV